MEIWGRCLVWSCLLFISNEYLQILYCTCSSSWRLACNSVSRIGMRFPRVDLQTHMHRQTCSSVCLHCCQKSLHTCSTARTINWTLYSSASKPRERQKRHKKGGEGRGRVENESVLRSCQMFCCLHFFRFCCASSKFSDVCFKYVDTCIQKFYENKNLISTVHSYDMNMQHRCHLKSSWQHNTEVV